MRVPGSGFKVQGSGFRVQGPRFRIQGSTPDFMCWGSQYGIHPAGVGVQVPTPVDPLVAHLQVLGFRFQS